MNYGTLYIYLHKTYIIFTIPLPILPSSYYNILTVNHVVFSTCQCRLFCSPLQLSSLASRTHTNTHTHTHYDTLDTHGLWYMCVWGNVYIYSVHTHVCIYECTHVSLCLKSVLKSQLSSVFGFRKPERRDPLWHHALFTCKDV